MHFRYEIEKSRHGYRAVMPDARVGVNPSTLALALAGGDQEDEKVGVSGFIERVGEEFVSRGNAFENDRIYLELADCKTKKDLIEFANMYGFLDVPREKRAEVKRERVRAWFEARNVFRSLCGLARFPPSGGRPDPEWEALKKWWRKNNRDREPFRAAVQLLFPGERGGPALFFQPRTLREAMYLQFFDDLVGNVEVKKCSNPDCGKWFKSSGPGRKSTKRFHCSEQCRKHSAYLRRKKRTRRTKRG